MNLVKKNMEAMSEALFGVFIFSIVVICVGSILVDMTMSESKSAPVVTKVKLEPVDNETLNGRNFYLITNPNKTYTYVVKAKDDAIEPKFVGIENVKVYQDEEVKPYAIVISQKIVQKDTSWLMPNIFTIIGWNSKNERTIISDASEVHIPANGVRYYIPEATE